VNALLTHAACLVVGFIVGTIGGVLFVWWALDRRGWTIRIGDKAET
jgi:hypothetical protein